MRNIFTFALILVSIACWGKSNKVDMEYFPIDKARYKAVYSLNFIEDTVKRKVKSTLATLLIGDSVTVYADNHKIEGDSASYLFGIKNPGKNRGWVHYYHFLWELNFDTVFTEIILLKTT